LPSTAGYGRKATIAETLAVSRRLAALLAEQARAGDRRAQAQDRGRRALCRTHPARPVPGGHGVHEHCSIDRALAGIPCGLFGPHSQQAIRQELVQPQTVARALHPLAILDEPLAKVVIAVDLGALDPALRRA
jgi:hypothetical protein